MESQPQNPEFRHNPENFHSCVPCFFHAVTWVGLQSLIVSLDSDYYFPHISR